MNLVSNKDPVLTTSCQYFDFSEPPFDPVEFSQELVKFMYEHNSIGLAANQVGVPYQIFVMRGDPENFVCFNPKIVLPSVEVVSLEEGCLSYPGLLVKVKRPQHVRVRFHTPNGDVLTKTFTGLTARIFQHELEHLEGKRFIDNANRYHKEQALKKWKHTSNQQALQINVSKAKEFYYGVNNA